MSHDDNTTRLNVSLPETHAQHILSIEFFYAGKKYPVNMNKLPFMIGREEQSCDLVIDGAMISRNHCSIEIRENQLGLMDKSTNGTFVKLGRAESVFIRNEFCPLAGQGYIKLGEALSLDDAQLLMFKVVSR
ncbi:MAG: hypothetical protein RL497_1747 [Pseudomonadota bacterium]|jgi:predicted component of type VI protein secretion system